MILIFRFLGSLYFFVDEYLKVFGGAESKPHNRILKFNIAEQKLKIDLVKFLISYIGSAILNFKVLFSNLDSAPLKTLSYSSTRKYNDTAKRLRFWQISSSPINSAYGNWLKSFFWYHLRAHRPLCQFLTI